MLKYPALIMLAKSGTPLDLKVHKAPTEENTDSTERMKNPS